MYRGKTQVCNLSLWKVFLSEMKVLTKVQVENTEKHVRGHMNHEYHLELDKWGFDAKEANPRRR